MFGTRASLDRASLHRERYHPRLGVVLLAAFALYLALVARGRIDVGGTVYFSLVDDTMISMRYAANLAAGDGLVWNVGEEPIQGFSNLGYTLLLAVFHLLPIPTRFGAVLPILLTSAALLATAAFTYRTVHRLRPTHPWAALVAAAVVASDFGLVFWSTRGMEVSLVTLPLMFSLAVAVGPDSTGNRSLAAIAVASAIGSLVRLDATPSFVVIFAALLIVALRSSRADAVRVILWGLVPAFTIGAMLLFQRIYFGEWLPNTYHLKTQGVTASERIEVGWQVFRDNALPQILVFAAVASIGWFVGRRTHRSTPYGLLAALCIVPMTYSIWVGGDYAEPQVHAPNRFLLLAIPPLAALAALSLVDIASEFQRRLRGGWVAPGLTIAIVFGLLAPNAGNWSELAFGDIPLWASDRDRTRLGVHLEEVTPTETIIATHTAGQIPYYSQRTVIDLLGKSDRVIARAEPAAPFRPGHNKWDYEYSIGALKPDIVADEWGDVGSYLAGSGEFTRLDNGIWVRNNTSVLLDLAALGACYRNCS